MRIPMLATTLYQPSKTPKGAMLIVHGMMEHRRRYNEFAKTMCENGWVVLTYDQRGHGQTAESSEELGYFADERGWKLLIEDCHLCLDELRREYPNIPLVLFGHSMGTLVARSVLKRYDSLVDGVVLCGAPNYTNLAPLGLKIAKFLAKKNPRGRSDFLKNMVLGPFSKAIPHAKTDCDWLSVNEENVQEYLQDPYCHFNFTNAAYEDLMFGMIDMHDTMRWNLQNPDCPILLIAGADDPCTGKDKGLDRTIGRLKEAGYHDIELFVYAGLRHELLQEKERVSIINDISRWLEKNVLINIQTEA